MSHREDNASPKMFFGWWVLFAAVVGLAASPVPFAFMTIGVFMKPLGAEFGWNRAQVSGAYFVANFMTALATPLAGMLLDRYGVRKVLFPSMLIGSMSLASLYYLTNSIWHLYSVFFLIGVMAAGVSGVLFSRVITAWFDEKRGMALGLTMSGIGLGAVITPIFAQVLIDQYGWREAYLGLGSVMLVVGFPTVFFLLRESPLEMGLNADGKRKEKQLRPGEQATATGVAFRDAWHKSAFWMIGISFLLYSFGLNGIIAHLIPLMTDRQFDVTSAALAASIMGTLIMFSRAGVGLLLDYFFAPHVAMIFFLLGASGLLFLALGESSILVFLGAVLVGSGIGAQTNIMSFLIGRHFGLVAYGTIYGYMYSAFIIGASVSPLALGLMFEMRGSYNAMLYINVGVIAFAAAVILRLGPYPNLQTDSASR